PLALPPIEQLPEVEVAVTWPLEPVLSEAPWGIVAVAPVRLQTAALLSVRLMVIALGAATGLPRLSTALARIVAVETPSAPMVPGVAVRCTAPTTPGDGLGDGL